MRKKKSEREAKMESIKDENKQYRLKQQQLRKGKIVQHQQD